MYLLVHEEQNLVNKKYKTEKVENVEGKERWWWH